MSNLGRASCQLASHGSYSNTLCKFETLIFRDTVVDINCNNTLAMGYDDVKQHISKLTWAQIQIPQNLSRTQTVRFRVTFFPQKF